MKALIAVIMMAASFQVSAASKDEVNEMLATMINLSGNLCAKVSKVLPLEQKGVYEVTCVEYRGGSAQKTYIFDSSTGKAFGQ